MGERLTLSRKELQIPDVQTEDFLSAFGNNELKALTLIAMADGNLYDDFSLRRKLGWTGNRGRFTGYCTHSLAPIGLVVKEAIDSGSYTPWGYRITDFGSGKGVPLAGALLKWSLDHPQLSLYQMFGSTSSHVFKDGNGESEEKKRSAQTRLKIFWELSTVSNNTTTLAYLTTSLNEYPTLIAQHIENLDRLGVVTLDSIKPGEPFSYYRQAENPPIEKPRPARTEYLLTENVHGILQKSKERWLTIEDVVDELVKINSRYQNYFNLVPEVARILADLKRQGYAQVQKFSHFFRSEITFTEEQREAMASLVALVDAFQRPDPETFREGKVTASAIIVNSQLINRLLTRGIEASPLTDAAEPEETLSMVYKILSERSNRTVEEIQAALEEKYHKSYARNTLRTLLTNFTKGQRLYREKTKRGFVYSFNI